jgi:hypothetical protein
MEEFMVDRFFKGSILSSCIILLLNQSADATESCNAVLTAHGFSARQLVDLSSLSPLGNAAPRRVPSSGVLNIGYIVPGYEWTSGALVVKVRHKIADNSNDPNLVPNTKISLYRERHTTPCTHKSRREYSNSLATSDYINYHQFKQYSDELDDFHTEIGYRPSTNFVGWTSQSCMSTSNDAVRSQFLFDDDPAIRWRPSKTGVALKVSQNVPGELGAPPLYAAPAGYKEYVNLLSMIVPYQKTGNQPACLVLKIKIPAHALETDLMTVNSDDALVYAQDQDPQTVLRIDWLH